MSGKLRGFSWFGKQEVKILTENELIFFNDYHLGNWRMRTALLQFLEENKDILVLHNRMDCFFGCDIVSNSEVKVTNGKVLLCFEEDYGEVSPEERANGLVNTLYIEIHSYPCTVENFDKTIEVTENSIRFVKDNQD